MPLDSAAYLTSLGWQGTGSGLRKGGMVKPLAIPQKRTLAGVGKDRDEAFPFWDHVFNAAANSIKIKIHNDSDQSDAESEQPGAPKPVLSRTSTGIISNRRPITTPRSSDGPKQTDDTSHTADKRLTLLAEAKRQAAHARLYATFYRGLVIPPIDEQFESTKCKAENKTQGTDIITDCDTHLLDTDTHIRPKTAKSSKKYKKTLNAGALEKENATQTTEVLDSKNGYIEACIEETITKDGLKQSEKKRRRHSVTEDKGSFEGKGQLDMEDAACDVGEPRKGKKRKKIKEPEGELVKQSDTAGMRREERKRKKKKKDKQDKDTRSK